MQSLTGIRALGLLVASPAEAGGELLGVGVGPDVAELPEHPASASSSVVNTASKNRFMVSSPRASSNRASICGGYALRRRKLDDSKRCAAHETCRLTPTFFRTRPRIWPVLKELAGGRGLVRRNEVRFSPLHHGNELSLFRNAA